MKDLKSIHYISVTLIKGINFKLSISFHQLNWAKYRIYRCGMTVQKNKYIIIHHFGWSLSKQQEIGTLS